MKFPKLPKLSQIFPFWPFRKKDPDTQRKYGWHPDLPDHRDYLFQIKRPIELPSKMDLRANLIPVFDQGQLGSCFHPDTKVPLLNGNEYTIKELSEGIAGDSFWVYSVDESGKMVPGKATAQLTGMNKKLMRVVLDNDEEILCTPDHRFLLRNGEYLKAEKLRAGQSLMPLYRKKSEKGYELTKCNSDGKFHYTHWMVGNYVHENEIKFIKKEINKSVVLHHVNFCKHDNTPENLRPMTWMGHAMLHAELGRENLLKWNGTEKQREHSRKLAKKMHDENPGWNIEGCSKGGKKNWELIKSNPDRMIKAIAGLEIGRTNPEVRERARISLKKKLNSEGMRDKLSKIRKLSWSETSKNSEIVERFKKRGIELGKNSGRNKIILWAKEIIDQNNSLTEELWNEKKKNGVHNFAKFSSIFKYFTSLAELEEAARTHNHKVKSIEFLDEVSNVYCLTVEKHENFALSSGVYVHNCTANAISSAYAFNMHKQVEDEIFVPSRLFIYYNEREMDGSIPYDSGARIRDGIKSINKIGVCDELIWPYDIAKFAEKPIQECYVQAGRNKAVKYERLNNSEKELKTCLALGFPFVFGFTVYESFESKAVAKTGRMVMPGRKEKSLGGHAVLGVGYDDSLKCFIIKNSWGERWGDKGYFYMPYDYITDSDLCADFWVVQKVS